MQGSHSCDKAKFRIDRFKIAEPVQDSSGFLVKVTYISHISPLCTYLTLICVKTMGKWTPWEEQYRVVLILKY